ncbi:MAG: beta-N-acetylhexosaminidase, partial [Clostridiales bacterium]|nr:beta-N-acetylhexosaminidase [Clostridiales bacterium]
MKKALAVLLGLAMVLPMAACTPATDVTDTTPSDTDATTTSAAETSETQATTEATPEKKYERYANMTPEEIVAELTLEQKVSQMVQPILYNITEKPMKENCYGSIYGDEGAQDVT